MWSKCLKFNRPQGRRSGILSDHLRCLSENIALHVMTSEGAKSVSEQRARTVLIYDMYTI